MYSRGATTIMPGLVDAIVPAQLITSSSAVAVGRTPQLQMHGDGYIASASCELGLPAIPSVEQRIVSDLKRFDPSCIIRFGSLARRMKEMTEQRPHDIDLIYIGNQDITPIVEADYGYPFQVFPVRIRTTHRIASFIARHPPWLVGYGASLEAHLRRNAIVQILSCIMIGSNYRLFGIENIEVAYRTDPRDYSIHDVLYGEQYWEDLLVGVKDKVMRVVKKHEKKMSKRKPAEPGY